MPKKTTTAAKKARGTYRPGRDQGPQIAALTRVPPPPKTLPLGAGDHWKRIGKECVKRRTLSSGDLGALGEASRAAYLLDKLNAMLEAEGSTQETRDGRVIPSSVFREIRQWTSEYRSWLRQLGLTPASRPSVDSVGDAPETSEFSKFQARGGVR